MSDNFTEVEIVGVVYFENTWKIRKLEEWHDTCSLLGIDINLIKIKLKIGIKIEA